MADIADDGENVISGPARESIVQGLPDGPEVVDIGRRELMGTDEPEQLYRLPGDAVPAPGVEPDVRSPLAGGHRLPTSGRLIGRDVDVDAVDRLLAEHRIVTLTGPGGSGKTSVAVAVARRQTGHVDGTWFVDLQPLSDPAGVPDAIAVAVGLLDDMRGSAGSKLADFMHHRDVLLVVDNFEQVIDAATVVGELASAASSASRFLVTSREALHLSVEQEYPLGPLRLPGDGESPEVARTAPALELFIDRTARVRPGYEPGAAEIEHLASICRSAAGLPLGIELAAARMAYLPAETIAELLAQRIDLPGPGHRDLPERQRSLRATIAWSVDLLGTADRALLGELSVFRGGFGLREAELVASGPATTVLDGILRLVARSLLLLDPDPAVPRYRLLEPVRLFASEILDERGDADDVRAAHARTYRDLAERMSKSFSGSGQGQALRRLDADEDNLDTALRWAVGAGDAETAFRLGAAMWRAWMSRARMAGRRADLETALLLPAGASPSLARERALEAMGGIHYWSGELEQAEHRYQAQLDVATEIDDGKGIGDAWLNLAFVAFFQADIDAVHARWAACVERYQALGLDGMVARAEWFSAVELVAMGAAETATDMLQAMGRRFELEGDIFWASTSLSSLALAVAILRDYEAALGWLRRCFEGVRQLDDLTLMISTVHDTYLTLLAAGRRDAAEESYRALEGTCRRHGVQPPEPPPFVLEGLGIAQEHELLRERYRELPPHRGEEIGVRALLDRTESLVDSVLGSGLRRAVGRAAVAEAARSAGRFVREGDTWAISFGDREVRLRDSKGLGYLGRLLTTPGREYAASELLMRSPAPSSERLELYRGDDLWVAGGGPEPVIDAQARSAYEARLMELQADIAEATHDGDIERAARDRDEFEQVADHLTASLGLGGRVRDATSPAERARQSVTKAIRASLRRVEAEHRSLGEHFAHSVRTGRYCAYDPDPSATPVWTVVLG